MASFFLWELILEARDFFFFLKILGNLGAVVEKAVTAAHCVPSKGHTEDSAKLSTHWAHGNSDTLNCWPVTSASRSKAMPAAVLQTEFLSKGCHEPTLPMKDAGELLSQRDMGELRDMVICLCRAPEPKGFRLQRA